MNSRGTNLSVWSVAYRTEKGISSRCVFADNIVRATTTFLKEMDGSRSLDDIVRIDRTWPEYPVDELVALSEAIG